MGFTLTRRITSTRLGCEAMSCPLIMRNQISHVQIKNGGRKGKRPLADGVINPEFLKAGTECTM